MNVIGSSTQCTCATYIIICFGFHVIRFVDFFQGMDRRRKVDQRLPYSRVFSQTLVEKKLKNRGTTYESIKST